MFTQTEILSAILNSVLTTSTERNVKYKREEDPVSTNNPSRFFELSLPEGVKKDNVKHIFITACKKETLLNEEYFKLLSPQTSHFIFSPSFKDNFLRINLENTSVNTEGDSKTACILKIKKEFKEKEKEAFEKIFEDERDKLTNTYNDKIPYHNPDQSLKIFSEFKTKYITNELGAIRTEEDVITLFKNIIDSLFTEEIMKEHVLKYAESYFTSAVFFKNVQLTCIPAKEKINTVDFNKWPPVFAKVFSEVLTSEHLELFKEYISQDILNIDFINQSEMLSSLALSIHEALYDTYNVKGGFITLGWIQLNVTNLSIDIKIILRALKVQYSYFHVVLKEIHRIAQNTKKAAENINNCSGGDIDKFKELLTEYQQAFDVTEGNTIQLFIEDSEAKLKEIVERKDFETKKDQLGIFNAIKGNQMVLQFTLILDKSKYVYPELYVFSDDTLEPILDKADVELYKIINGMGTEGPQGPKGDTGRRGPVGDKGNTGIQEKKELRGHKGETGVNKNSSKQNINFFLTFPYQIFFLICLILLTGVVFYLIFMAANQ